MKGLKITFVLMAAALMTFVFSGSALALHDGGVGHCDACHSMHNSADNPVTGATNNTLLKGSDASSTCLNCHKSTDGARYHIMSPDGSGNSQGGDFYWMTKDYSVVVRGNPVLYSKDDHGHNVVAADYAMLADANPNNATAPGGTYLATNLGCNSCHDPHGKVQNAAGTGLGTANGAAPVSGSGSTGAAWPTDGSVLGNYRLLGATGYVAPGGLTFASLVPVARATNPSGETYGARVDYGSGMSEFCANCHGLYRNDSHKHPAGNGDHLNGQGTNYNSYVATGNFTGAQATAYDALVPFERGVTDVTTTSTALSADPVLGTDASSNVMCLTCHRAHASANANAGRWDFEVELLADSHALNSADVDLTTANVYYKSGTNGMVDNDIAGEYGPYQRSLCNKCHVQD